MLRRLGSRRLQFRDHQAEIFVVVEIQLEFRDALTLGLVDFGEEAVGDEFRDQRLALSEVVANLAEQDRCGR